MKWYNHIAEADEMKTKFLSPIITIIPVLVGCAPTSSVTPKPVEVLFSNTYTKVKDPDDGKDLPFTFDSKHSKASKCMKTYYLSDADLKFESVSGNYFNMGTAINFTPTRKIKCMTLGSRSEGANLTWTFARTIDSIKVYLEPYVKYDSYRKQYNVDYATSLTVNSQKFEVSPHSEEDKNDTVDHEFTINSNTITFFVPFEENSDPEDTKAYRIYIHQIDFTFKM